MSNDNRNSRGRFANQLFRNVSSHLIAKKYNLKFQYGQQDDFDKLGISFFTAGQNFFDNTIYFEDEFNSEYLKYILSDEPMYLPENLKSNFNLTNSHCQHPESARFVHSFLNDPDTKQSIIGHNKYKDRYNNNNDVFVHVRLDDASQYCPPIEYFEHALDSLQFTNGYISSDSIDDEFCKKLINKYNLQVVKEDAPTTIQFGSTCNHVVLSGGTFSWMIGVMGFHSDITFPIQKIRWHGDIFIFEDWKGIKC
uniref:Uncharacterized protein n=1 Tax=viral metagenome TaxID=1070528 RepID=A0A6C0KU92_9ZZZZ